MHGKNINDLCVHRDVRYLIKIKVLRFTDSSILDTRRRASLRRSSAGTGIGNSIPRARRSRVKLLFICDQAATFFAGVNIWISRKPKPVHNVRGVFLSELEEVVVLGVVIALSGEQLDRGICTTTARRLRRARAFAMKLR